MLLLPKSYRLFSDRVGLGLEVGQLVFRVLGLNIERFQSQSQVVEAVVESVDSGEELFGVHYGFPPGMSAASSSVSRTRLRASWSDHMSTWVWAVLRLRMA